MPGMAEEIPYLAETSLELNRIGSDQLTGEVREAGDSDEIVLHGQCPKCSHFMETVINTTPYLGVPSTTAEEAFTITPRKAKLAVDCRCSISHPNADGKRGCGRCWELVGRWTGREGIVELMPSPSLAECQTAEDLRALTTSELSRIRKGAESWRTGLAGLLALVTTLTVVKGRQSISGIQFGQRISVGILLAVALSFAAVAALLAMRAAYGSLHRSQLGEGGLPALLQSESDKALKALIWTRRLTVGSLVLIVAAIGITWYGSNAPSVPPAYLRSTTANGAECGQLIGLSNGKIVLQEKKLLSAIRIPLTELTGLQIVKSCG